MNDTQYVRVPIQAYIIPSVDAHQVSGNETESIVI